MKLSTSEQQRLDRIGEALAADDPQLAALLTGGASPQVNPGRWRRVWSAVRAGLANLWLSMS